MKDQRKTEIRVGITVVIGFLIFLWIFGWAKNISFVSNEKEITVKFNNVAGLEVGDNVTVNGVREGYVKNMDVNKNSVYVILSLDKKVNLRKDAKFTIAMLDLMGGKKIEIQPGTSNQGINYKKIQNGTFAADIPFVMSMVGNLQDGLSKSLKDLNVTLNSLNNYLTDQKLNRNLKNTVANLSGVTFKLNKVLDENRSSIRHLLKNSNELAVDSKKFLDNNKNEITESLKGLQSVLFKTDTLLSKMNYLADETTNKKNNLGKMLYDREFYNSLKLSLKQLNELSKIIIGELKDEGIKVDAHLNIF